MEKNHMWIADNWKDYEVLDFYEGEKLERWGSYILVRPDPQVIWNTEKTLKTWHTVNGHYHRSSRGGGEWEFFDLPEQWTINYKSLTFHLKPFSFKHTGLFPEQAVNWDWFSEKIKQAGRPIKVNWAKENAHSSKLSDAPIRWLTDDCIKFVEREIRRKNQYDGIIMDPPSYGRGPKGELWKLEDSLYEFIKLCTKVLSKNPLFFLINSYTTGLAPSVLTYMMSTEIVKQYGGTIEASEIGLPVSSNHLVLPCGASARWSQ